MTDTNDTNAGGGAEGPDDGPARRRRRVIGTPPATGPALAAEDPREAAEAGAAYPGMFHARPEKEQRSGERWASVAFLVAMVAGIGFFVAYFAFRIGEHAPEGSATLAARYSNFGLGLSLAIALLAIAVGMTIWVRKVMPHYEVVDERHDPPSGGERREFGDYFMKGANESGIVKRPMLRRTLLLAMVPLGLAPIVLLRDLGPNNIEVLRHTAWAPGPDGRPRRLLIEGTNQPILAAEFDSPGSIITVLPEPDPGEDGHEGHLSLTEQAKAVTLLIKMRPEELALPPERLDFTIDGIIAYSKVCTHVGCAAALYEQTTHRILCPCHQSTFDARNGGEVIFGPAGRALPMLPLAVDSEGYLVAVSDYPDAVGPSFWERGPNFWERGNEHLDPEEGS